MVFAENTKNLGRSPVAEYTGQMLQADHHLGFDLVLAVNKSAVPQTMSVFRKGKLLFNFVVSTGLGVPVYDRSSQRKRSTSTPTGRFVPIRTHLSWRSGQRDEEMPFAVFYDGGWAIHGASSQKAVSELGKPASMGCVRVAIVEAEVIFRLVREHPNRTLIVIYGN